MPQRRPALAIALVASALVAVAAIAVTLVAPAALTGAELLALVVAIAVLALAFEALAAVSLLLGSRFARGCAFGGGGGRCGGFHRGARARLLKLLVAAPAMMFALLAFPGLALILILTLTPILTLALGRPRAVLRLVRAAMAVAVVMRTALLRAAAGTPDFDKLRFRGNGRSGFRACGFRRRSVARGRGFRSGFGTGFSSSLRRCGLRGFNGSRFGFGDRLRLHFDDDRRCLAGGEFGRIRRQRGGRRGIAGHRLIDDLRDRFFRRAHGCFGGRIHRSFRRRFRRRLYRCSFGSYRLGGRFNHRLRRQWRAALHAVAERAQDRGEVLAGRARERGHRLRHHKAAAIESAGRLLARRVLAP